MAGAGQEEEEGRWADLAPELLENVVQRVQDRRGEKGEARRVVAMSGVCRRWRQQILMSKACVGETRVLQFPRALAHPGPRQHHHHAAPLQCLIKRRGSLFLLFQTLGDGGNDKHFLLAARRRWLPTGFSYIIGMDPKSLSNKRGPGVLGKLRSNFWASEFVLWEKGDDDRGSQSDAGSTILNEGLPVVSLRFLEHIVNGIRQRRISCVLPQPCKGLGLNFVLETLQKRNGQKLIPVSVRSWLGWSCITPVNLKGERRAYGGLRNSSRMLEIRNSSTNNTADAAESREDRHEEGSSVLVEADSSNDEGLSLELRSKVPAWDAHQQCWSLDFKGRATMPSMHNFQLIRSEGEGGGTVDSIVLQLGKIGKNVYTMDFCYPMSAFQAFAICLSSFATSAGLEP